MITQLAGFFTPWIIYAVITMLHYFLPGRRVTGYVRHSQSGELLRYRLNGILVLAISVLLWVLLGYLGWVPYDWLYVIRWYSLAGAFTLGLVFSLIMVLPYPSTGKPWLADLFLGRLENPQFRNGQIDAKIWLYLIGAVMLQLNVLGFAAHHYLLFGKLSPSIILCGAMLTFFVWDYLTFEKVHLYTYDFFAERLGLKLGWGCLTFYPYFYSIALWPSAGLPDPNMSSWQLICFILIFISGWILSRGANMQKYFFKTHPEKIFLGIKPKTISDGNMTLLTNGFWGFSRHINYLGEILMSLAIALSVGHPGILWVWLYPLYYIVLLSLRQIDDDKRCSSKYGDLWKDYTKKVKYRIIPYLY
jgi:protein-S-isoprenylcysteine O-methyltransferase Ste14